MKNGARVQAAIEVLLDCQDFKRPPALALKDWALRHRFAGSKDRSAIGDIVFMALRLRALSSYVLNSEIPRAWVLGALRLGFNIDVETIKNMAFDNQHSFSPLTEDEEKALKNPDYKDADAWVIGNYPEWLDDSLKEVFGDNRASEMAAMSKPAPLDFRVNIAKSTREDVIASLKTSPKLNSEPQLTELSPWGVRIEWENGKNFPWAVEPAFLDGSFEVQDEASQLCAALTGAKEDMVIADVCAGGGGKTLALAAMTNNKAKIIAYDHDANRIAPIHERLRRAGAKNIDVRTKRRGLDTFQDVLGKLDIVLVDAPCTGAGTWRRAPDTKWRITEQNIEKRQKDQQEAINLGAPLVKKGGKLFYVTCSLLPQENDYSVKTFLENNKDFESVDIEKHLNELGYGSLLEKVYKTQYGINFTPLKSNTDGFFFSVLQRK